MVARLQSDICCRALCCLASSPQRIHLGMRLACLRMVALPNDLQFMWFINTPQVYTMPCVCTSKVAWPSEVLSDGLCMQPTLP